MYVFSPDVWLISIIVKLQHRTDLNVASGWFTNDILLIKVLK